MPATLFTMRERIGYISQWFAVMVQGDTFTEAEAVSLLSLIQQTIRRKSVVGGSKQHGHRVDVVGKSRPKSKKKRTK